MEHRHSFYTLGRLLFGLPFIVFGVLHFVNLEVMTGVVPDYVPFQAAWVMITGAILILSGLGIVTQKYTREVTLALGAFLLVVILLVHVPNFKQALPNLLKDTALLGGVLMLMSRYKHHE